MHRTLRSILCALFAALTVLPLAADDKTTTDEKTQKVIDDCRATGLPLIIIETEDGVDPSYSYIYPPDGCWGVGITNLSKPHGRLVYTVDGDTLYDSGTYEHERSGMTIRARGNTSAGVGVRPSYKVKLTKKFDLLFRDDPDYKNKHWVLLNISQAYHVKYFAGAALGRWLRFPYVPSGKYVNVVINGTYAGPYILSENVKRDKKRVDVDKSGYILENDAYWWNTTDSTFKGHVLNYAMAYSFKYPESDELTPETYKYIAKYVNDFEDCLTSYGDVSQWVDLNSFARWVLGHDILGTYDAGGSNMFLTKNDTLDSPLCMGPLWDIDSAFRTTDEYATIHWSPYAFYYNYFFLHKNFVETYLNMWQQRRDGLKDYVVSQVDSLLADQGDALELSYKLFYKYYRISRYRVDDNYKEFTQWMDRRMVFLDSALVVMQNDLNPVVEVAAAPQRVEVFDLQGRLRATVSARAPRTAADLNLPAGVYIFRVLDTEGRLVTTEKRVLR